MWKAPAPRVGGFLILRNPTELKVSHRLMHNADLDAILNA